MLRATQLQLDTTRKAVGGAPCLDLSARTAASTPTSTNLLRLLPLLQQADRRVARQRNHVVEADQKYVTCHHFSPRVLLPMSTAFMADGRVGHAVLGSYTWKICSILQSL